VSEQQAIFLPIEIETDVAVEREPVDVPMPSLSAPLSASRVDTPNQIVAGC